MTLDGLSSMTWNYRVLSRSAGDTTWYGLYEVYYDDKGEPVHCSEREASPYGETAEELKADFEAQSTAFGKPVLRWEDFGA